MQRFRALNPYAIWRIWHATLRSFLYRRSLTLQSFAQRAIDQALGQGRSDHVCLLAGVAALMLTACDAHKVDTALEAPAQSIAATQAIWPRTLHTAHGDITLQAAPRRIVSTSVTLTGTLLAINAPVIASGGTRASSNVTDARGFFTQWSEVAKARGVQVLYNAEPNAEVIAAAAPDLIVVAATGGDSAVRLHEQLRQIAPTVIINYDDKSWQELATALGKIIGHEEDAAALNARFEAQIQQTCARLALPPQPTTAMVYYEDDSGANVWTAESAQGQLLHKLGFELADVPASVKGNTSMGKRRDIVELSGEKFAEGIQGRTLLLFSADAQTTAQVKRNHFLAAAPAVAQNNTYAVGLDTFRLDYYSASALLDRLQRLFPRQDNRAENGRNQDTSVTPMTPCLPI